MPERKHTHLLPPQHTPWTFPVRVGLQACSFEGEKLTLRGESRMVILLLKHNRLSLKYDADDEVEGQWALNASTRSCENGQQEKEDEQTLLYKPKAEKKGLPKAKVSRLFRPK